MMPKLHVPNFETTAAINAAAERNSFYPGNVEPHAHLGTSTPPLILWQQARALGYTPDELGTDDYHEFAKDISISPKNPVPLNKFFGSVYHYKLDPYTSGTQAVYAAANAIFGLGYANGVTVNEGRWNPAKHNLNKRVDLDHLIVSYLDGMKRALLDHPRLAAGTIFCMGRELDFETNQKIAKKAIEYIGSGVVGIDIAGPGTPGFRMKDYSKVTNAVREKGGRVTIHTAEVEDADDIEDALLYLSPDRIGHGIRMALWTPDKKEQRRRNKVLEVLAALSIPLEICPLSNAATKAVVRTERNGKKYSRTEQFHDAFKRLDEFGVPYMIGTDWPAIIKGGDYASQMKWLLAKGILSPEQREKAICTGMDYSFIPGSGHKVYLGKP